VELRVNRKVQTQAVTMSELDNGALSGVQRSWVVDRPEAARRCEKPTGSDWFPPVRQQRDAVPERGVVETPTNYFRRARSSLISDHETLVAEQTPTNRLERANEKCSSSNSGYLTRLSAWYTGTRIYLKTIVHILPKL